MALPATSPGLYLQEEPRACSEMCSVASQGSVFLPLLPVLLFLSPFAIPISSVVQVVFVTLLN